MNKEQTKKIILGAIGLVILLYVYFSFFLGPLNKTRYSLTARSAALQGRLTSSKEEIAKTAKLEQNARAANKRYEALRSLAPDGAPIAWFPPRVKTFLFNHQIDKASARLAGTGSFTDKELAAWNRYTWVIDVPQADFHALGHAVAALENAEPLLIITRLRIAAMQQDPEMQQVSLMVSTIISRQ